MNPEEDTFTQRVIDIVGRIPRGKTMTYREVARRAGNEKAVRAVGGVLNRYYEDCLVTGRKTIPCHRVIRSDGEIGGYARGGEEKRRLLKEEGAI